MNEAEKRKKEIEEYRQEEEKLLEEMTEEEMTEYLLKMYQDNEKIIRKYNLKTISEEDIK